MKAPFRLSVFALLLPFLPAAVPAAELTLSDAERAELVTLFEDSRSHFEELVARTTGEDWSKTPAEGKWSVGEVAEHIILAEEGTLAMVRASLEGEMDLEWQTIAETTTGQLVGMLSDRSQTFEAPDPFVPRGGMSRADLLEKFGQIRARTLDFVRTTDAPLKGYTAEGPAGKMNAHQWLALIAGHNLRHNAQITEAQEMIASR